MEKKTIEEMAAEYTTSVCKFNPGQEPFAGFIHTAYLKGANDAGGGIENYGLDFSQALNHLKAGHQVGRRCWDMGTYLWLKHPADVKEEWCKDEHLKTIAHNNGGSIFAQGTICIMRNYRQIESGYSPSQDDMMAEDWEVVG